MSLEQLERDVAELKVQVAELMAQQGPSSTASPKGDWLPAVLGRFKDDPEFAAAMATGREFRKTGGFADDAPHEGAP